MKLLLLMLALWLLTCTSYAEPIAVENKEWLLIEQGLYSNENLDEHELGRLLFFDPRLSKQMRSCATCHHPGLGWADASPHPMGSKNALLRHTPSLVNIAFTKNFFWDGRGVSLESSIREHILSLDVDASDGKSPLQGIIHLEQYRQQFKEIFGSVDMNLTLVSKALVTFIKSISTGSTPFDRWVSGHSSAVSNSAKRGFYLFTHKARCHHCHSSPTFSDHKFHDIGLDSVDPGRFEITRKPEDMNAFRTPSLRHIAVTAPYMHDGSLADLKAVIDFYNRGGDQKSLRNTLIPLLLSEEEKEDLLHFLYSLTGENTEVIVPTLPTNIQIPQQLLNPSFKNVL